MDAGLSCGAPAGSPHPQVTRPICGLHGWHAVERGTVLSVAGSKAQQGSCSGNRGAHLAWGIIMWMLPATSERVAESE